MRKAFTLIEMMIAISILSIMMIYLYTTNASVNKSNIFYAKQVNKLNQLTLKKRVLFLDISFMLYRQYSIIHNNKNEDILFLQTTNSLHKRVNPFVAYIVKNKKLYRLESFKKLIYPFSQDDKFDVDYFGDIEHFRVYKQKKRETFLVDLQLKNADRVLMKVNALNEY